MFYVRYFANDGKNKFQALGGTALVDGRELPIVTYDSFEKADKVAASWNDAAKARGSAGRYVAEEI